eukprot:1161013-Pelagomonas_calceolata.AAC.5
MAVQSAADPVGAQQCSLQPILVLTQCSLQLLFMVVQPAADHGADGHGVLTIVVWCTAVQPAADRGADSHGVLTIVVCLQPILVLTMVVLVVMVPTDPGGAEHAGCGGLGVLCSVQWRVMGWDSGKTTF